MLDCGSLLCQFPGARQIAGMGGTPLDAGGALRRAGLLLWRNLNDHFRLLPGGYRQTNRNQIQRWGDQLNQYQDPKSMDQGRAVTDASQDQYGQR